MLNEGRGWRGFVTTVGCALALGPRVRLSRRAPMIGRRSLVRGRPHRARVSLGLELGEAIADGALGDLEQNTQMNGGGDAMLHEGVEDVPVGIADEITQERASAGREACAGQEREETPLIRRR